MSVAVIGGGISGLVCAARLQQLGVNNVTVFDTGKHAPGGRCSSRHVVVNGRTQVFDHSAQYFTVSDPQFANIVSFLHKKGAVRIWQGPVGNLRRNGKFEKFDNNYQAFIGASGMRSVSEGLASMVNIKRPVWIGNVKWTENKWQVDRFGFYDYLVIAHNGKCADQLMADAGAPEIHKLLQVRFGDRVISKDPRMQLCSFWALLVAFPKSLKLPYEGAHVDDDVISWMANNTRKIGSSSSASAPPDPTECWTIFSTRSFATRHKVPQENIPPKKAAEVTDLMLDSFAKLTRTDLQKVKPIYTSVQLWGAAIPMNLWGEKERSIFDGLRHVGICGDWVVTSSIQGAALSGMDLAERISQHIKGIPSSTKLTQTFSVPKMPSAIGDFTVKPDFIFRPK